MGRGTKLSRPNVDIITSISFSPWGGARGIDSAFFSFLCPLTNGFKPNQPLGPWSGFLHESVSGEKA
jgi:hypothetical protein